MNLSVFIGLPTYNRGQKCANVIQQIVNQIHTNWKLCIIDDGSLEEHGVIIREKVKELNDERVVYLKNEQNIKLVKTLNRSIDVFLESGYDFFTWVSDDNEYFPEFVSNLAVPGKDFIYSDHIIKDKNSKTEIRKEYKTARDILDGFWGLGSFMWSRATIKKTGYYNYGLTLLEDYDYLVRTLLHLNPEQIEYRNVLSMEYDSHDDSLYSKNLSFIRSKHKELVSFYYKIDVHKPIIVFFSLSNVAAFINDYSCNKIVVIDEDKMECNWKTDCIFLGKQYIELAVNLFLLIDSKKTIYCDSEEQIKEMKEKLFADIDYTSEIFSGKTCFTDIEWIHN
jgi:glycosyltransferase involved in cell wall biosynthesis